MANDFNPRNLRRAIKNDDTWRLERDLELFLRVKQTTNAERRDFMIREIRAELDRRGIKHD